ncbi:D-alanyl-D-alanine carboxypeptidase (penicillin-binding protein 5/6) [Saccharomonospora amisosensis]|uniref:D-alanyl-D-alanine carboxypeptidase (Penicillin-binding protein 5/6) n=1 Tax=Saccharomonospora amisosensis TaxID=1128677 RepID=A0A7X5UTX4_9PSEU|nr:D-alanyl-D-alanine carboxypeptidase family protein [Saccharomonospora amisosensis]NIJ14090.1 D-alanyl-D-alanine carboxypeptidase (penicillin-binding protein 5/6) [Saccharomonospora amisosensis]
MRSASTTRLAFVSLSALVAIVAVPVPALALGQPAQPPAPVVQECANRQLPPPPVDTSEQPRPGESSPAPLPVPATPAGGERMAECGLVLPGPTPSSPRQLTAASWLVQDMETGEVLAAKDPHARHRPASLIKTLLALVVLDELPPDKIVVASRADAEQECTCVGLVAGGHYEVEVLLRALLMRSGNDVAHALATAVGGVDVAVSKMNALAERLGARDTRAATPSGLDGPGMVTSAYDMSLIFGHAMRQPRYAKAVATRQLMFPGGPGKPDYPVYNDNNLWQSYPGFLGGKTGFTDDARHTYAGAASREGRRLAVVLLRAEQRPSRVSEQAARLLDYGFALAAAGTRPVGTLRQDTPATAGTSAEQQPEVSVAATSAQDPFGTTGWIVTLVVTVLVIVGMITAHRRGLLRRPE